MTPDSNQTAAPSQPPPSETLSPDHHIAASTSLPERRASTLKHGDTFLVFHPGGDIDGAPGNPEGLYHADTRILSRFQLRLEGQRALLLSSTTGDDNAIYTAELTNPDLMASGEIALARERIHLHRMRFVWEGACHERLLLRSYSDQLQRLRLRLDFAADFADLFEVRGERRPGRGTSSARVRTPASVELRYMGLDAVERITRVDFDPAPALLDAASAEFDVALAPRGEQRIFVRLGRTHAASPSAEWTGRTFFRNLRAARRALRSATGRAAAIDTSNAMFREVLRRSAADLYMLVTETDQGPYPYAGTPWFNAPFGRDGLLTALMTLWLDPAIAKGVLRFLAATQATALEPERDAQPGKILHELRQGEMARLREVPFGRYYGSVDATPLFVLLLGEYVRRTGDIALARELWPHVEAALAWIDTYGDPDGDGFVEYARASENGLVNQGWKDSHDAVFHADGSAAGAPIALCEVQAYVYGAKSSAAEVAAALGYTAASSRLGREAQALRARFDAAFWCEDLGAYALALDGEKRACRVVSSNAGHVLLTGLAGTERARRVAQTLLATDCFSGWGVRTLATSAHRYNPMSYHNGSVWPHDNALIALGFARYGLKSAVLKILEGLFDAAAHMPLMRLPELFCGFARRRRNPPTLYPVACAPQAWASTAMMALVRAALGLELAGATNEIAFHDPVLPRFLDELQLRRLRLAGGSADVVVHRDGKRAAAVRVSRCDEAVRVVVRR